MIKNWKEFDLSEELYNEPKEGEEKPSKETGFFSTLTFQVILCLAITIILVLLNTFFPSQYHDIDSELKTLIQEDGGFAEDMEGIKGQFERWLNKEQATILPDVGESSTDINSTEETISSVVSEDAASDTEDNVSSETAAAGGEPNGEAQIPANVSMQSYTFQNDIASPLKNLSVTSAFGARTHPITGEQDFHKGIDLAADEGTEIKVILAGTVMEAEESEGYGKHIRVRHADGNESFYAHCSKLLVKEGDAVKKGQVIAEVGSTGMSTGPHLHFGYLINSKFVDPAAVLDRA